MVFSMNRELEVFQWLQCIGNSMKYGVATIIIQNKEVQFIE